MDELPAFLTTRRMDRLPAIRRADLDPLLRVIARMVLEGTPGVGSYLIVDCEGVFVQFAGSCGDTELRCEAVSNHYLPVERQLSQRQVSSLLDLGFAEPARSPDEPGSKGSPNFHRAIDVATETRLYEAALLVIILFRDIYGCHEDADISWNLQLAVWPADDDAT